MTTQDWDSRQRTRALAGAHRRRADRAPGARSRDWSSSRPPAIGCSTAPLSETGGKRLFVKEIEDALLARRHRRRGAQRQRHVRRAPDGWNRGGAAARRSARRACAARGKRPEISHQRFSARRRRGRRHGQRPPACAVARRPAACPVRRLRGNVDTRLRQARDAGISTRWSSRPPGCGASVSGPDRREHAARRLRPGAGQGIIAMETRSDDNGTSCGWRDATIPRSEYRVDR